jgi:imidazolonepropionase-like amidohydrolase
MRVLLLTVLAPLLWWSLAAQSSATVAITHVAVIDVGAGRLLTDRTVLLRGDVIDTVGAAAEVRVPESARIVDGRGGFLIPGLWDMHTHLSYARPSALPVLVANGVTYVRDLGSATAEVNAWRGEIADGLRVGPVIVRAGPILNGQAFNRYQLAITNASDGTAAVRALFETGVDLVKVHRRTSRDAYFAVLAEAKQLSLPVAGHVPMTVSPEEASNAGQQTIEHVDTLFEGTFSAALNSTPLASAIRAWRQSAAATKLFQTFVRNGTVVDATLMNAFRINAFLENPDDPRDKYFPASGLREFAAAIEQARKNGRQMLAARRELPHELSAVVGQLYGAGVRIVTGSDMSAYLVHPGFAVHEELQRLSDAGIPAVDVLRAATVNPAALFPGVRAGEVSSGRRSNLVLLDANPLENVRNAARIRAVILGTRVFDRRALDNLLTNAAAEAARN